VDRSSPQDTVAAVVEQFARREKLILALAPEGTRRPGAEWKSGFWHIARGAGVPVLPVVFDWDAHAIRILPPFVPVDLDRDMRDVRARYAAFRGHGG
jgi:1-acyl-sn-glycerol-3-phosphate acyltransferase